MTLLTVDAKMMPILPLIARPASTRALVVAFGMGSAFRTALIAGLRTDAVELVPVRARRCSATTTRTPTSVLANPNGRVIIADGRNHLELTDKTRFDIIVTDPPPPIESSGASVISSREYYQAGHDHLTPDGIMMEWVPYGQTIDEFKTHVRAFASVFPQRHDRVRARRLRHVHARLGRSRSRSTTTSIAAVLARPGHPRGHLERRMTAPTNTVAGWTAQIDALTWLSGDGRHRLRRRRADGHRRPAVVGVLPAPAAGRARTSPMAVPADPARRRPTRRWLRTRSRARRLDRRRLAGPASAWSPGAAVFALYLALWAGLS